jgi:site-specific recombinase XerD
MAVCNALFEYLKGEEVVRDNPFSAFKAIKSKKEVSWGSFTVDELESLYDYCLNLKDRGVTKKLYFEFLITMTCRKSIAQNLKFKNIKRKLNREDQQYYWVLTGFDKTQEINRAIPNDLYQRLSDNFSTYSEKDKQAGLVFNVENQTLERTLNEFCKYAGIDKEERRLCQHSLKSTGLDIIYDTFNDIKMVAEAAGHADINVDYSKYIGKIKNFAKQPSILLSMTRDHCKEELDELSKEELLNIIMSCDEFVAKKLCLKKDGVI